MLGYLFLGLLVFSLIVSFFIMTEGMMVLNYDGYDPNKKIESFRGWGGYGRGWGGHRWNGYGRGWYGPRWGRRGFYRPCVNCYECVGAECDACEYCSTL